MMMARRNGVVEVRIWQIPHSLPLLGDHGPTNLYKQLDHRTATLSPQANGGKLEILDFHWNKDDLRRVTLA